MNDIFLMLIDMDLSLELFLCPAIVELMLWIFLKDAYICVKIYTPHIKMCEYVCIYWCKYGWNLFCNERWSTLCTSHARVLPSSFDYLEQGSSSPLPLHVLVFWGSSWSDPYIFGCFYCTSVHTNWDAIHMYRLYIPSPGPCFSMVQYPSIWSI